MGKNKSLTVLTALVLCACYVMTAVLFLGLKNFDNFLMAWGKDLQMTVYLKEETPPEDVQKLIAWIKADATVHDVHEVTPEENLNHFKAQMGNMLPQIENDKEIRAMIPSTLQVIFDLKNTLTDPLQIFAKMAQSIQEKPIVEQVSYGQMWVEKFSRFFGFIRQIFWVISFVMIVASVFVFSNAVRAWVHAKRFEIEVLELVGATGWTIRKPYLARGLALGFLTGGVALAIVLALTNDLRDFLASNEMLATLAQRISSFSISEGILFLVFSTGLGLVAAYMCVKEINNGWAAAERN